MTTPPSGIVPEFLRKDNYERWEICMRHYLVGHDLWGVVESSQTSKGKEMNEREWNKKNALALQAIKISCGAKMLRRIEQAKSATEAWSRLTNICSTKEFRLCKNGERDFSTSKGFNEFHSKKLLVGLFKDKNTGWSYYLKTFVVRFVLTDRDLVNTDKRGNTPLSLVARYGKTDIAKCLVEKNRNLLTIKDANGKIPVQVACKAGYEDTASYLYRKTPLECLNPEQGCGLDLLKECVTKKMFGIASDLIEKFPELKSQSYENFTELPSSESSTPIDDIHNKTAIILMLVQSSASPFLGEIHRSRLGILKRLIYHCIIVKPDLVKPIAEDEKNGGLWLTLKKLADNPWIAVRLMIGTCTVCGIVPAVKTIFDFIVAVVMGLLLFIYQIAMTIGVLGVGIATCIGGCLAPCLWPIFVCILAPLGCILDCVNVIVSNVASLVIYLMFEVFLPLCAGLLYGLLFGLNITFLGLLVLVLGLLSMVLELPSMLLKFTGIKQIYDMKLNNKYGQKFLSQLCEHLKQQDGEIDLAKTKIVEATFLAIKNGISDVAIALIRAVEHGFGSQDNPEDQSGNMFVWSIVHRQEKVARVLYYELHDTNDKIFTFKEAEDNNILHVAARLAPEAQLNWISGAALQLQSELKWFRAVEGIVPRYFTESKNKDGETPTQVFVREHKSLLKDAEDWVKKAAESATVVGALIITIMFTAAFTVPGGNNQDTGLPIFSNNMAFQVFIICDAISLFAASSSVLMFFGILTSRYAWKDFLKILPMKLLFGLSSLFISLATMMAAFCAALFIMQQGRLLMVIPITLLAGVPVIFFVMLQFPLFVEILTSTFSSGIFHKRKTFREWLRCE